MAFVTQDFPEQVRSLSDEEWLAFLIRHSDVRSADGITLPGLPDAPAMLRLAGVSRVEALEGASVFYRTVKAYCDALAMPIARHRRVLDFGVGWGRLPRFFAKDVDVANLFSCDFDTGLLELCRETGTPGSLDRLYPKGKLPYPDKVFDCIVAASALSHLPEADHLHWVRELARVAAPGCVFTCAVQSRRLLDALAAPDAAAGVTKLPEQAAAAELLKTYSSGGFVYIPPAGEDAAAQGKGEAIVPVEYITRHWKPFEVRDTIDEAHRFAKAVVIVQYA